MSEFPGFRDNLDAINAMFPTGGILNIEQIREFTGFRDARTIRKYLGYAMDGEYISKANLARHYAMPASDRETLQRRHRQKTERRGRS